MDIIISHSSAFEYWRAHRNAKIPAAEKPRRKGLPTAIPDIAEVYERTPPGLSFPVNLMVDNPNARRQSRAVLSHVYSTPIPPWCFTRIGDGLYVSSPSFCFFQMAEELPFIKLIELGIELCGTYSLPVKDEQGSGKSDSGSSGKSRSGSSGKSSGNGSKSNDSGSKSESESFPDPKATDKTLYNCPPLTNTKELKAFATRMEGVNGYKNICRALRFIADGSASPMETKVFLFLTLPYKLGGYGLPKPEMNRRVETGRAATQKFGKAFYKCDFFWPEANLVVEYDSDSYHTGPKRIEDDSIKRFDLNALGIETITLTRGQIQSASEFEKVAKLIAKRIGKRLCNKDPQFAKAQKELRRALTRMF